MAGERTVTLRWFESVNGGDRFALRGFAPVHTGPQMFVATETPPDPARSIPGTVVRLDYDVWQDMGGPAEITVTVKAVR
jgi:hypothetical protein